MNAKQKKNLQRIGIVLASILIIIYVGFQSYRVIYNPVDTETANEYTIEDTVETTAFIARSETFVTNSRAGTIIAGVENGARIAKGQEVALIFSDPEAADTYSKLLELSAQIERYKRLASQSDNYIFNINDLDRYIDVAAIDVVNVVGSKNFVTLPEKVNDFRNQVVTRQIATGTNLDFDARLRSLETQYNNTKVKNTAHASILAENSGFYINGTDGYETAVDCKNVKSLTVQDVAGLLQAKPKAPPTGAIGKIITDFNWYLCCVVDSNLIGDLQVGKTITVNLPFASINTVRANVVAINENGKDEAAVILSCNLMNSNISGLRRETAELVIGSYTGLRIPASAIRVNKEGEKGVYVKNGNIAKFRKVNIIYTSDDYVLSAADANDDSYVRLYDDVILKGKDLYDGKVIK